MNDDLLNQALSDMNIPVYEESAKQRALQIALSEFDAVQNEAVEKNSIIKTDKDNKGNDIKKVWKWRGLVTSAITVTLLVWIAIPLWTANSSFLEHDSIGQNTSQHQTSKNHSVDYRQERDYLRNQMNGVTAIWDKIFNLIPIKNWGTPWGGESKADHEPVYNLPQEKGNAKSLTHEESAKKIEKEKNSTIKTIKLAPTVPHISIENSPSKLKASSLEPGIFSIPKTVTANLVAPQLPIAKAAFLLKERFQGEYFINDSLHPNDFVTLVIEPYIDFDLMAKLVVGNYWKEASLEERINFKREFKALIIRSYFYPIFEFDNWTIHFLPLSMETAVKEVNDIDIVMVKTEIFQPDTDESTWPVDFRMRKINEEWKAFDMEIQQISLVKNYRASIRARIKAMGFSLAAVTNYLAKINSDALSTK